MAVVNSSRFNLKEGIDWAVKKYLEDYNQDVIREVTTVVPQVAREAARMLRQTAPKESGKYARGWASKVERGRLKIGATVYGKHGTYQLAHLLEHGHAVRNGGRASGNAKAIVHIAPVEEWAVGEVVDRTIERLSSV